MIFIIQKGRVVNYGMCLARFLLYQGVGVDPTLDSFAFWMVVAVMSSPSSGA